MIINSVAAEDITVLKEVVQIAEKGFDPSDYISKLDIRQAQILLAALNMGKAEPVYETEEENIKRLQHNFSHPNNLIPEPSYRKGDMYALFLGYISDCNWVGSIQDVLNEFEWRGDWPYHAEHIKDALIILGIDF